MLSEILINHFSKFKCQHLSFAYSGKKNIVKYCLKCGEILEDFYCTHLFTTPIKLTLSNGAITVREKCNECGYVGKSLKISEYLDLPISGTLEDYKETQEMYPDWDTINEIKSIYKQNKYLNKKDTYHEYLQSDKWKQKRQIILQRDNYKCKICNAKATDVHHLTYANIYNEHDFELISLCRNCHQNYHK